MKNLRNEPMALSARKGRTGDREKGVNDVNSLLHGNFPNEPNPTFVSFVSLWFTRRNYETKPMLDAPKIYRRNPRHPRLEANTGFLPNEPNPSTGHDSVDFYTGLRRQTGTRGTCPSRFYER